MLDADLAKLYGVATSNLNKAVKRNIDRFPGDFVFQLTAQEASNLRFQYGISKVARHARLRPSLVESGKRLERSEAVERLERLERAAEWMAIRQLMAPPEPKKRKIGFLVEEKAAAYGRK